MTIRCGYIAQGVAAYLFSLYEWRPNATGESPYINDTRVSANDQRRVIKWRDDSKLADLAALDRLLIRYDLAIWEYETWAMETYGNNTYFDTDAIIQELLAAGQTEK